MLGLVLMGEELAAVDLSEGLAKTRPKLAKIVLQSWRCRLHSVPEAHRVVIPDDFAPAPLKISLLPCQNATPFAEYAARKIKPSCVAAATVFFSATCCTCLKIAVSFVSRRWFAPRA